MSVSQTIFPLFAILSVLRSVAGAADIPRSIEKAKREHALRIAKIKLQINDAEQTTIKRLEKLAAQAVKQGDLPAASSAWTEVLSLDREHKKARGYFQTIGQLENTLNRLPAAAGSTTLPIAMERLRQNLAGTVWQWKTDRLSFRPDGVLLWTGDVNTNRRWSVFEHNSVIIRYPNGIYDLMVFDKTGMSYRAYSLGRAKRMPRWSGRGKRLK